MCNLDITKEFPVGNAAGWCKSLREVHSLAQSAASFIIVGSITMEPREGNPGNTFNGDTMYGLNSLGLPNPGINAIERESKEMIQAAQDEEKPIILSIAGFSPEEYAQLAVRAYACGFNGIELNLGCPNVVAKSKRKPIICYQADLVRKILTRVFFSSQPKRFVSVKVSPMDPERITEIGSIISGFPIDAVVTQNAVPNCLDFDSNGQTAIQTPDKTGFAGASGKQVFQQALGQVAQWRAILPSSMQVWGVGGIHSGLDVQKMLLAGASAVQVGTLYFVSGVQIFSTIATEFVNHREGEVS